MQAWEPRVASIEAAASHIHEAYDQIKHHNLPFSMAIARYHNGDSLGYREITEGEELFHYVRDLKPGDISQVIQIKSSFYIFKVVADD